MNIYVTGFHGAGTNSAAMYFAGKENLLFLREMDIKLSFVGAITNKGISLQCPRLDYKAVDLSRYGKVYWLTRNHDDLIKTMISMRFPPFNMMKNFKSEFLGDPVWELVKYDGSEDAYYDFPGYCTLFVKIKDYLMNKYLLPFVEVLRTEEMPYWTKPTERQLTVKQQEYSDWYKSYWNEILKDLT